MDCNLEGRIRKSQLQARKGLWPVFEAVVNSLQSIDDGGVLAGHVRVHIARDGDQRLIDETTSLAPVRGFVITDNGVGFTEANYKSFKQSDSTYKVARGGKGVGRLLWLVAFDSANIESTYTEAGVFWRRAMRFGIEYDGVKDDAHERLENPVAVTTRVNLDGFKPKFRDAVEPDARGIAAAILEHCLQYFLRENAPRIEVTDDASPEKISLNDLYAETIGKNRVTGTFTLGAHKFQIDHFHVATKAPQDHSIHFCAHQRAVTRKRLAEKIPNLGNRIEGMGTTGNGTVISNASNGFVYTGYVSGDYLDRAVNAERTNFQFSDSEGLFAEDLTEETVTNAAVNTVEKHLEPQLAKNREDLQAKVTRVIMDEMPEARPLLRKVEQVVRSLSPNADGKTIRRKINELQFEHDTALRESVSDLLDKTGTGKVSEDEARQAAEKIVASVTEGTKNRLLSYVAFRKTILSIYEKQIGLQHTGKFSKEDAVHEIIFPRRATSDDVPFDEHNLWIIDDKLAFHQLLASDVPFSELKQVSIGSKKRCDLLVINRPAAFSHTPDDVSSVVIVELKRPERDDYTLDDNPLQQVLDYIDEIRAGKAAAVDGRTITLNAHTPFYVYIVSDITPTLAKVIKNHSVLTQTPDAQGYFGFFRNHNAYVEVMTFHKLIGDAKKRNRVWFKTLGIE